MLPVSFHVMTVVSASCYHCEFVSKQYVIWYWPTMPCSCEDQSGIVLLFRECFHCHTLSQVTAVSSAECKKPSLTSLVLVVDRSHVRLLLSYVADDVVFGY